MKNFWYFAKKLRYYKKLLALAGLAVFLDAAFAFGGYGILMYVVDQFLNRTQTLYSLIETKLSTPFAKQWIGDPSVILDYIPKDEFQGFVISMAVILVFTLLGMVARFIHQYIAVTVSYRTVLRIRKQLFRHLVRLQMTTVDQENTTDKISRLVQDCHGLVMGFTTLMSKSIRNLSQGFVLLAIALLVDPMMTLIFLGGAPLIGVLLQKFGKRIRRAAKRLMRENANMLQSILEALQSIVVVKVYQAEGYERRRFNCINRRAYEAQISARLTRSLSSPIIEAVAITGVIGVSIIAAWYIFKYDRQPTDLIKVLICLGSAGASMRPLANLSNDMHHAGAAADRLKEILDAAVEENYHENIKGSKPRLPRHQQGVTFENIQFSYAPKEVHLETDSSNSLQDDLQTNSQASSQMIQPIQALKGVSLHVKFGQVCAIVGGNGSGKSTLLHLLSRLYQPQQGVVKIDGQDINQFSLRSLRSQISVVTQDSVLFDGNVFDNIAYGRRYVTKEQVVRASKLAHAHEFIDKMPQGYETEIGEWGSRLSGGQKQRICIARAILRDPAILILDEATSQIDTDSEAKINQAIQTIRKGRTIFAIAHRLSTVVDADLIVVMDQGRIVDQGKHKELLERCGIYQVLTRTQLLVSEAS